VKRLAAIFVFLLVAQLCHGQDIIVRTNNDTLRAYIIDIKKNIIKFIFTEDVDAPIYQLHKSLVKLILFEDGTKLNIISDPYEVPSDRLIDTRDQSIKIDVVAPLLNHFTISYERRLRKGLNLELKGGLIATNVNTSITHSEGFFVKAGVKFLSLRESYMKGLKYTLLHDGVYFTPELIYGRFKSDDETGTIEYSNYAVNVLFGNQRVWSNRFLFDVFAGFGYGIQESSNEVDFTYAFSHLFFGKKVPLIISAGVMVGIVF